MVPEQSSRQQAGDYHPLRVSEETQRKLNTYHKIQHGLLCFNKGVSLLTMEEASAFLSDPSMVDLEISQPPRRAPPRNLDHKVVHLRRVPGVGSGVTHHGSTFTTFAAQFCHADGRRTQRRALLDTCAGLSLIDAELAKQLGTALIAKPIQIDGIGTVKSAGFVQLALRIPGFQDGKACVMETTHEFYVVDRLGPQVIFGSEFIAGHDISIHLAHQRAQIAQGPWFEISNRPIPVAQELQQAMAAKMSSRRARKRRRSYINRSSYWLMATEPVSLPPLHSCWVSGVWNRPPPAESMAISSACYGDVVNDSWILVENCVVGKAVGCMVTNVGTNEAHIPRGAKLSTAVPVEDKDCLPFDARSTTTLREHLVDCFVADLCQPFDEKDDPTFSSPRTGDDKTTMIDDFFEVGVDPVTGQAPPQLVSLLRKYIKAFSLDGRPGKVNNYPGMKVPLAEDAKLSPEPPRRVSPDKKRRIEEFVDALLRDDIIGLSNSPTAYPVLLVLQNGKWRFCVDYRNLNLATLPDKYPLQRPDDVFEALGGHCIFSALDAVKGYHQLPVAPEDQWKTAFSCHKGLFEYKRVPFGLKGAPAYFQRFMDTLLGSLRWKSAMVYLDDVVVFAKTMEEHLAALSTLFERAEQCGLKFSPKKCHFGLRSIKLLGKRVSAAGVSILEDRAAAIANLALPTTFKELHHQLGLFGHYRTHIPRYKEIAAVLEKRLEGTRYEKRHGSRTIVVTKEGERKDPSTWALNLSADEVQAIERLKAALVKATRLAFPDFSRRFFLYIDASRQAFAAALHQQFLTLADCSAFPARIAGVDLNKLKLEQRADDLWGPFVRDLEQSLPRTGYGLVDGLLVRVDEDTICLPRSAAKEYLRIAHGDAHWGFAKTHAAMVRDFNHPSMAELVRSFVKHCPDCMRVKVRPKVGRIEELVCPTDIPFDVISFDVMLGLPDVDGLDSCLVVLDTFTKCVLFQPMSKRSSAEDVFRMLDKLILQRGWRPRVIISDADRRFTGDVARLWGEKIGASFKTTSPYHQQANPVERYVQTAKNALRQMCLDRGVRSWVSEIPHLELTMNSTPSTVTGYAPFDLLYITHPRLLDFLLEHSGVGAFQERLTFSKKRVEQSIEAMMKAKAEQRERYNKRRQNLEPLVVNDRVMVRLQDRPLDANREGNTLEPRLEGPFRVARILSQHRVELDLPEDMGIEKVFDVSQLQRCTDGDPHGRPPLLPETEQDEQFEPVEIVDERLFAGRYQQYLVRWKGSSRLTWTFEEDLLAEGCTEVIQRWMEHLARDLGTPPPRPGQHRADTPDWTGSSSRQLAAVQPSILMDPVYQSAADAMDKPIVRPTKLTVDGKVYLRVERPIAFSSRLAVGKERDYVGPELELCGLAWAFSKFKHYLEGSPCTVVTDHAPLEALSRPGRIRILLRSLVVYDNACHHTFTT